MNRRKEDNNEREKPEILALNEAVLSAEDSDWIRSNAVYIGGEMYGLRAKAKTSPPRDMKKGEYAHSRGKKVYVTANITARNRDLEGVRDYFHELKNIRPDTLIISDPGVFHCQKVCPEIDIHISTREQQCKFCALSFWKDQGAVRVVTAGSSP